MLGLNTIAKKLPLMLVLSAAVVSLGVGTGSYLIGSQMVSTLTQNNLSALAYERGADGTRRGLHPVKECSSFGDAANALRQDYLNRMGGRSRYVQ